MAVTIADLEVNIRDNGQSATLALNALINTLSKLASNIAPATKGLKETTKELKTVEKTADKAASGGLGKFFKSIVRIAGYRAIRSALKMITSSFREGVQNIALYSQAIGGVDASKANEVMSAYASMGAQIKNSLGAAVMPLLANLMPTIQKVANLFMDAAEAVAKFFAALNGQTKYTAANRDYWVDYAKGLNKSTGAAKELKRTILGFDEINALQKQTSGGSGSSALDYGDMFVEKTNDITKEKAKEILAIVTAIGSALLAWRVSSSVSDAIEGLREIKKGFNGKTFALGLALSIVGVGFGFAGGQNLANGDITTGLYESIGGVVATAIGGTLMGASMGHPLIGLAFGLILGLASVAAGYASQRAVNGAKAAIAEACKGTGLTVDDVYGDAVQAHINMNTEIRGRITNITGLADPKSLAELAYARDLIAQIFELDGIDIKTPEQVYTLKYLIEQLNEIGLEGIRVEFDELTGKVRENKEELYAAIDALEQKIKTEAMQEAIKETYKDLWVAQHNLTEQIKKRDVAERAFVDYMHAANLQQAIDLYWIAKANGTASGTAQELFETWSDWDGAVTDTKDNIADLQTKYDSFVAAAKREIQGLATETKNAFEPTKIINPYKWSEAIKSAVAIMPKLDIIASGSSVQIKASAKASGGLVPTGDLFWAGERAPELIMSAPGGSEVVNMAQFQDAMVSAVMMAGGNGGGDWTIVVQDESGAVRSRQVITAAERANRRDGRTIVPVGVQ